MGGWRLGKGRSYPKAEDWKSKPMTAKFVKPKVRIHTFFTFCVYSHTSPQSDIFLSYMSTVRQIGVCSYTLF